MKHHVLIQPMTSALSYSLAGLIIKSSANTQLRRALDASYGVENTDWEILMVDQKGIYVSFQDGQQAMRFKLSWSPMPTST